MKRFWTRAIVIQRLPIVWVCIKALSAESSSAIRLQEELMAVSIQPKGHKGRLISGNALRDVPAE